MVPGVRPVLVTITACPLLREEFPGPVECRQPRGFVERFHIEYRAFTVPLDDLGSHGDDGDDQGRDGDP